MAFLIGGGVLFQFQKASMASQLAAPAAKNGALTPLQGEVAPNFTLTDQYGKKISLDQFRGKAVVLMPMDSTCQTICPVLAMEVKQAAQQLGSQNSRVVFLAFNVDPYHNRVQDVQRFDRLHGLTHLQNWYFTTGSKQAILAVARKYYISVQLLPKTQSVNHASYMFFIGPHGHERYLSGASANKSITGSYSALIVEYVNKVLPHGWF